MRETCYNCFKPKDYCLCKYLTPKIKSGIKFLLLMHPKEARKIRTGTGRITSAALSDSEILIGIDFSKNKRFLELISNKKYFPLLLYPDSNAWTAKTPSLVSAAKTKTLLVIILDATWFCAKKILDANPTLLGLPRLSFYGDYRSIFTFKHEPRPECISTIESCYYLINELKENGVVCKDCNPEPLMKAFRKMISNQIKAENDRILGKRESTHCYDWKYTKVREIPFTE